MDTEFSRLAVVNRGEAAMRLLNAVPEFNLEHGTDIATIALYTEPDRHSWFVREADEAVSLGPASAPQPTGIQEPTEDPGDTDITGKPDRDPGHQTLAYLDYGRLEAALLVARADAVWVGWGFVSEHAEFAALCERLGIVFIGPPSDVIRRLGDKVASKQLAEAAGVPVVPWGGGPAPDLDTARNQAQELGYPLLVKAAAGGGGRGIRPADSADELDAAFTTAVSEATHAVGDPTVFLEKRLDQARHIEVQVIADHHDTVWAAGLRDCSIQRRNQKVIEESGSTVLTPEQTREAMDAAVRLCARAGYRNAGTVEFLYTPEDRSFWFMEVNARLQVEHPVTEFTTGLDLVKLQLEVARGGRLEGDPPATMGHAIEVRLNAEDPDRDFTPSPGRVTYFRAPSGPGIRVETGVAEGDDIAPEFDSMIAKVIAWGRDRDEARARLTRAIRRCHVVVEGGTTNKSFLLGLLEHPDVISGEFDTGWLDRLTARGEHVRRDHGDVALLQAATEAYDTQGAVEQARFFTSAARGRPEVSQDPFRDFSFRHGGHLYELRVSRVAEDTYRVLSGDRAVDVGLERLGPYERRLQIWGRQFHTVSVTQGPRHLVEVDGVSHSVSRDEGGVVRAPAPAVVVSVPVAPGDEVDAGDPLVVVESMKMETAVRAPFAGRVRNVAVRPSVQVDAGSPLVELDPRGNDDGHEGGVRVRFEATVATPAGSPEERCRPLFEALHSQLAGYDATREDRDATARQLGEVCAELGVDHPSVVEGEMRCLSLFADISALSRRRPDVDVAEGGVARSAEDHLLAFLRSPERAAEELPERFLRRLASAMSHYRVRPGEDGTAPVRSAELDEALVWMYKAHQRLGEHAPVIAAILDRRLGGAPPRGELAEDLRRVLDRLVTGTENRYDAVADLAREARYAFFDKPLLEAARERVYGEMAQLLDQLSEDPPRTDRDATMATLVACPQPLGGMLVRRFGRADPQLQHLLLEVLIRRFYRIRDLQQLSRTDIDGHPAVIADYDHDGERIHLSAVYGPQTALAELAERVSRYLGTVDGTLVPVVEFYLRSDGPLGDADTIAADVAARLEQVDFGRPIRRIDVAVLDEASSPGAVASQHFTYRQSEERSEGTDRRPGLAEERRFRNLHPMLGKRNDLWRLSEFDIERLASVEDVYLFRGVARDNPGDERLFALAEVRDLTAVHGDDGRVAALPDLERMLMESLTAIRHHQSHRPAGRRLFWNQVILHVRPPWTIPAEDWHRLAGRLAPATRGLGLQKIVLRVREPADTDETNLVESDFVETDLEVAALGSGGLTIRRRAPERAPIAPLTPYRQKVVKTQRRGAVYPYELIRALTPSPETDSSFPPGEFVEHDLDEDGALVPVERPYGENSANLVVGTLRNITPKYPEGMTRVVLLGDPSRSLGSLSEPECRRIIAVLELAEQMAVPVEWFALSSGAKISMTSGTENMDWIGRVLRGLIEFTQRGGEVNVVVTGVTVGAQPYFNAEATMLMHTRGILVMTPDSAMVLTGKQALDYSGGVSAEDNLGIGGFDRVMGPNGQAQYFAADLYDACRILLAHYDNSYVAPGERFPRRAETTDPVQRDVRSFPHPPLGGSDFTTVGDIFSNTANPERKQPFDARTVMRAVSDADHEPLERWHDMLSADTSIVWDAHIGGIAVTLLGFESHPVARRGFVPADGPAAWTSGTLFPMSSKKTARAINAASGRKPLVVLANLSGFDGSPESMRRLQLEFGAEIGRAVTNFDGPMVFCVVSRYHGGAFVVFSKALNEQLEIAAVEGSRASVIGGAPAAAVVFARDVDTRTDADPRVEELAGRLADADGATAQQLALELRDLRAEVRSEKLGEVAEEFDTVHSIHRAREVGSVDHIIPGAELRPYIVDALERGMARTPSPPGIRSGSTP